MATLPDGTTVTLQAQQAWDINPPPTAAVSVASSSEQISIGDSVTVSGSATVNGSPASNKTIELTVTGPSTPSAENTTADANGDYSQIVGPFDTAGQYDITATVTGFERVETQRWNL